MADRDGLRPLGTDPVPKSVVILALFLPQLTFVDEATTRQELWSSSTVRKHGLVVDVTPTAAGLQGMHEYRKPSLRDHNGYLLPSAFPELQFCTTS